MKAEAVVDDIRKKVDYHVQLGGLGGAIVADLTNKKNAREWDENYLSPFKDEEIDAITQFLLDAHKPLAPHAGAGPDPVIGEPNATRGPAGKAVPEASSATRGTPKQAAGPGSDTTAEPSTHARNLKRWTAEEEARLREAFKAGQSPTHLADEFGRTARALRLRAVKLGLITDAIDWK